jgi:hypothetical protein
MTRIHGEPIRWGVTGDHPDFGLTPCVREIQRVDPYEVAAAPYTESDA